MAVVIKDKTFTPFISQEQIVEKIAIISQQIKNDYKDKDPLFLCILNGAFVFAADLYRALEIKAPISFVKLTSYQGIKTTGEVHTLIGLNEDLNGKDVVIIEDIVDTGLSLQHAYEVINTKDPNSIAVVSLLYKPKAYKADIKLDYTCFEIPNNFVIGYGMDYDGIGRHLPEIYTLA